MRETWVQFLGQEDPLEKEMATHSSILAWAIPWTEEPGGQQSMGSQWVGCDLATKQQAITEYWIEFPVLYSKFLLIIYFIYSSMYISQFIPPYPLSPGNPKCVFYICASTSVL